MALHWDAKDPDEILDYEIDWLGTEQDNGRLWGTTDTIATSTWIIPDGITGSSQSHTNTKTITWLSGGTEGTTYTIVNRIVTAGGRTHDQTVKIRIRTK